MDKIDGIDLAELVKDSAQDLMKEKRVGAANIVKNHLQRVEQLAIDIRTLEKELKNKKDKLVKAQSKIDKIKAGDWSVLAQKEDGPKGHNN